MSSKLWDKNSYQFRKLHRWNSGIDRLFHPTLNNGCNYISMLGLKLIRFNKMGPWLRVTKMADHMHRVLVWSFTKISLSRVEPGGNVTQFMVKYSICTFHEWPRPAFYCAMFALVPASVIHQSYWTVDWHWVSHTITAMSISHSHLALAPVPLSIFRSKSKFDENSKHSSVNIRGRSQRYFPHVTTVSLSWRVQNIVVIGRVYSKLERSEFSSNFEIDRNMLSGTGAWCGGHTNPSTFERRCEKMENTGYTYWLQATVPSINADRLMSTIGVRCWWSW